MAQVDDAVGQVLAAVDRVGASDDTLVIFTSDNGSYMNRHGDGEPDHVDDSFIQAYRVGRHRSNAAWRGTKADIWEGGHRVPFVVRWPGVVEPGSETAATVVHTDLYATLADIVGATPGPGAAEDSVSLLPMLRGGSVTRGVPVVHQSYHGMLAVRDGRWKLVLGNGSGGRQRPRGYPFRRPYQLFDLSQDPTESQDVAADHPEVVERREATFERFRLTGRSVPLDGADAVVTPPPDPVTQSDTVTQSDPAPAPELHVDVDYDADDDGLVEIATLAQLDAVRHDLDGDGVPVGSGTAAASGAAAHAAAFPDAAEGMGCPAPVCLGYELAADLDFDTDGSGAADAGDAFWNGGAGWRPIGTLDEPFTAVFAGNGRTVSHLFVGGGDNAGLFGLSSGVIRGVGVVDADVTGSRCAGALAGLNGGRVEASWSTGAVTGESCVGGLVGVNGLWVPDGGTFRPLEGFVTASWSSADATAEKWVGGLVGYDNGTVAASYATGAVTATTEGAGGLVGRMGFGENRITASYATGAVSGPGGSVGGLVGHAMPHDRVEASYWDTETSGLTESGGGAGQTSAALQEPTGYAGLYAAWDVDVDGDGLPDAPWDFGTPSAYPALSVDADGDGAATWRELGLQGRSAPPARASGAGAQAGGAAARAQAGGTAARASGAGAPAGGAAARAQAGGTAAPAAFTDDPLVPGVTPVRALHLLELRARIDALRLRAGLPAFAWTDARVVPGVTPARAAHLLDLRSALGEAYAAAGRPAPGYSDAVVTAGLTAMRAVHLLELRAAVAALERAPVAS